MPIQKARKGLQMSLPSRHRFLFGMLPHPRVKKEKKRKEIPPLPHRKQMQPQLCCQFQERWVLRRRSPVLLPPPSCVCLLSHLNGTIVRKEGKARQMKDGEVTGSVLLAGCAGSGTRTASEPSPGGRTRRTLIGFSFVI